MPPPKPFPCGGPGQPACPREPATLEDALAEVRAMRPAYSAVCAERDRLLQLQKEGDDLIATMRAKIFKEG